MTFGMDRVWADLVKNRLEIRGMQHLLHEGPVLDIGCGASGFVLGTKSLYPETLVVGIYFSEDSIKGAKKISEFNRIYHEKYKGFELMLSSPYSLPFKNETFSLLHSLLLFYEYNIDRSPLLCNNVEKFIEECYRVLKPGGLYIFAEGNNPPYEQTFLDKGFDYLEKDDNKFGSAILFQKPNKIIRSSAVLL